MLGNCFQKIKGLKMATMHELFDGSDAQELCSGTAETAFRGAEGSNPQRVETPHTVKDARYWLEWNLLNWAAWMHGGSVTRGLPSKVPVMEGYSTLDAHDEGAYDRLCASLASTTNAIIEGLKPNEQMAIYRAYGVMAAYRMHDYKRVLEGAKAGVLAGLRRRGVYLGD